MVSSVLKRKARCSPSRNSTSSTLQPGMSGSERERPSTGCAGRRHRSPIHRWGGGACRDRARSVERVSGSSVLAACTWPRNPPSRRGQWLHGQVERGAEDAVARAALNARCSARVSYAAGFAAPLHHTEGRPIPSGATPRELTGALTQQGRTRHPGEVRCSCYASVRRMLPRRDLIHGAPPRLRRRRSCSSASSHRTRAWRQLGQGR